MILNFMFDMIRSSFFVRKVNRVNPYQAIYNLTEKAKNFGGIKMLTTMLDREKILKIIKMRKDGGTSRRVKNADYHFPAHLRF